jgi:hypothetical protein
VTCKQVRDASETDWDSRSYRAEVGDGGDVMSDGVKEGEEAEVKR